MTKAYAFDNEQDGTTEIYWAEARNQAKAYFANENGIPYTWIHVYRVPWADKYNDMNDIPPEVYWKNGWWLPCEECGKQVFEGEGRVTGKGVLCLKCFREMEEEHEASNTHKKI